MNHPIAITKNGASVYIDLVRSPAATYISRSPYLIGLVKELVEQINATAPEIRMDHDMGRAIGNAYIVETTETDAIFYALRPRETFFTRFVKNTGPNPSQHLSIILLKDEEGAYALQAVWIGRLGSGRPGALDESDTSRTYWQDHAFVLEGESIQPRSVTKECPY